MAQAAVSRKLVHITEEVPSPFLILYTNMSTLLLLLFFIILLINIQKYSQSLYHYYSEKKSNGYYTTFHIQGKYVSKL